MLSALAHYTHMPTAVQFSICCISVVFVAAFLGKATESVAHYAGERMGGFLSATFGNAAELIIAIFLIKDGLFSIVKASITGSIIGNLLLVLGLSVFLGGLKYKEQNFNVKLAVHNASLMLLAVISLFIPATFVGSLTTRETKLMSVTVAGILIAAYLLWLVFSMITHKKKELGEEQNESEIPGIVLEDEVHEPQWSKFVSVLYLVLSTVMVAFLSEWLVGTVEDFANSFGLSELFVGGFLIAIIGNAAEHSAAVLLALKNRMGAAVEIAIGSSLQIALFVAPVLVIISFFFRPYDGYRIHQL